MSVVSMFVHRGPDDVRGLRYAASLAKRMNRKLEAVCALPDPAMASAYFGSEFVIGIGAIPIQTISDAETELMDASNRTFETVIAEVGLSSDQAVFRKAVGIPEQVAADAAVLADAIVFPRDAAGGNSSLRPALEFTMMDSGLPVVVAGTEDAASGPVIIGWDGSDQAARAVALHAGLIEAASSVVIAQAEDGLAKRPGGEAHLPDRLLAWLSDRNIKADVKALEGTPGKGLLNLAEGLNAEMIITGAYGHSRAGQFLFGGVTRTLMRADHAPALALSH